jgi:hypothetical protein
MPKILINEKDETFAGTPGRYGNYAVLITGYIGTPDTSKGGKVVSPDENGVYEFSSKSDFIATIGSATPEKIIGEEIAEYHYGNRMAEHLLNMGYPVVYRPITKISDMDNVAFWNIFRDKASYDFRFISHGLLETCYDAQEHTRLYNRKAKLKEDLKKLAEIEEAAKAVEKALLEL